MIFRILFIAFLIIGVAFLIASTAVFILSSKKQRACTQMVNAVIVDVKCVQQTNLDGGAPYTSYYPVYKYHYQGETYTLSSQTGGLKDSFSIGNAVTLLIDPGQPEQFTENSRIIPLLIGIFGGCGVLLLIAAFLFSRFM